MYGIFNYQVPGTNLVDNSAAGRGVENKPVKNFNAQPGQFGGQLNSMPNIIGLLVQLLTQIEDNNQKPDNGQEEITSLVIGEEDGGQNQPPGKVDATTLALGEEDDGGLNPPPGKVDATTLALGEEDDGGLNPPPGKVDATTLALGEEDDGGLNIDLEVDNGRPPEISTRALGEEDAGPGFNW